MLVDPENGRLEILVEGWTSREKAQQPPAKNLSTLGMNMFAPMRANASSAEEGASVLGDPAWMDTSDG